MILDLILIICIAVLLIAWSQSDIHWRQKYNKLCDDYEKDMDLYKRIFLEQNDDGK